MKPWSYRVIQQMVDLSVEIRSTIQTGDKQHLNVLLDRLDAILHKVNTYGDYES